MQGRLLEGKSRIYIQNNTNTNKNDDDDDNNNNYNNINNIFKRLNISM